MVVERYKISGKASVIVVDDFYHVPRDIREAALKSTYRQLCGVTGLRSAPHVDQGTRQLIEVILGKKISSWNSEDPDSSNGAFFLSFSEGPQSEEVRVHYDEPKSYLT